MALNIGFKGFVHDENGDQIDCKFQVLYQKPNKWNNVRETSAGYYSCNAGDADSLSQDGEVKNGDMILLAFWQGDGSNNIGGQYDNILSDGTFTQGVKLTSPIVDNCEFYFNGIAGYDASKPPELMFFSVNGETIKIDFATEYNGESFTVISDGVPYNGIFTKADDFANPVVLTPAVAGGTGDTRDAIFDRFGVFAIRHDGATADYTINVQIKPKLKPDINWALPETGTINRVIDAVNNSDDESAWSFEGTMFYHRKSYYGRTIFPKVGLLNSTYNWNDDNDDVPGYEDEDDHSFTHIGIYNVQLKVRNAWGLTSDDDKDIKIKYNVPIGALTFDPDGVNTKVHTTESSTGTASITDEDSRITKIEHNWVIRNRDNNTLIERTLVEENTTLDFAYTKTIDVLQKHYGEQKIYWNDGWEDQELLYTKELPITNWLPLVNFDYIFVNDSRIKFTPKCSDLDGTVDRYKWQLQALIPFKDGEYSVAKTDIFDDDREVSIDFTAAGHYKMVLYATDDFGGTASIAKEFDVTLTGDCAKAVAVGGDDVFFIIPDEYDY